MGMDDMSDEELQKQIQDIQDSISFGSYNAKDMMRQEAMMAELDARGYSIDERTVFIFRRR